MSKHAAATSVQAALLVDAPIERTFEAFTEEMASWRSPDHHILDGELAEMVFERRVGGHIHDRAVDGRECHWARMLACEPPSRVVFRWDIDVRWRLDSEPGKASEVEVRSVAEDAGRTRVALEHRHPTATATDGRTCARSSARRAGGRPASTGLPTTSRSDRPGGPASSSDDDPTR